MISPGKSHTNDDILAQILAELRTLLHAVPAEEARGIARACAVIEAHIGASNDAMFC